MRRRFSISSAIFPPPPNPMTGGTYYNYGPSTGAPNVSTERSQPFYHDYGLNPFNPTTANTTTPNGTFSATAATTYPRNGGVNTLKTPLWQGNSLGQDNDAAGYNPGTISGGAATPIVPHPLYQPHYDRDFTSVGELFDIPLYGPYGPQSPTTMINPGVSSGNTVALSSGLTHLMASRITENSGVLTTASSFTPERLIGADYIPTDAALAKQHYNGYGTAGFRFQHPEGGDQTNPNPDNATGVSDYTENRWFRFLGMVEVPTRSHRGIDDPNGVSAYQVAAGAINAGQGFYRTPGKINVNTLRSRRGRRPGGRTGHLQHELHGNAPQRAELADQSLGPLPPARRHHRRPRYGHGPAGSEHVHLDGVHGVRPGHVRRAEPA